METLQRTANRGSISTGFDIANSLKVESSNSEYFIRTFSSAGTQTTGTISFWIKRTSLGTFQREVDCSNASGNSSGVFFENDQLCLDFGGNGRHSLRSEAKLRDTSAWYHCMAVWDTTQSTNTERTKLYINGNRVTSFSTATYPLQNATSQFFTPNDGAGTGNNCLFSRHNPANLGEHTPNGYHAEFHYIDGTAKTPSDFGELDSATGIWIPIEYTGSHGSNGFYLSFEDAANLGDDESGNGNHWTETNITSADQATDTPTNNFCTFNPLMTQSNQPTISEGAMKSTGVPDNWSQTWGNIGVKNGKWYYEFKVANTSSTGYFGASTTPAEGSSTTAATVLYNTSFMLGQSPRIDYYYWQNGSLAANESTGWGTISTNDVIGIALDLDSATKTFTAYKNGIALSGTLSQPVALPTNMQDEFIFPLYVQYNDRQDEANFGGYTISSISTPETDENGYGTFEYAPPSGYYALCTKNLAEYG